MDELMKCMTDIITVTSEVESLLAKMRWRLKWMNDGKGNYLEHYTEYLNLSNQAQNKVELLKELHDTLEKY